MLILSPVVNYSLETFGWRATLRYFGAFILVVGSFCSLPMLPVGHKTRNMQRHLTKSRLVSKVTDGGRLTFMNYVIYPFDRFKFLVLIMLMFLIFLMHFNETCSIILIVCGKCLQTSSLSLIADVSGQRQSIVRKCACKSFATIQDTLGGDAGMIDPAIRTCQIVFTLWAILSPSSSHSQNRSPLRNQMESFSNNIDFLEHKLVYCILSILRKTRLKTRISVQGNGDFIFTCTFHYQKVMLALRGDNCMLLAHRP